VRRDALLVPFWRWPRAPRARGGRVDVHDVGVEYGRTLAGPWDRVIRARVSKPRWSHRRDLDGHGFAARAEEHDLEQSVVSDNCPFGAAAQHHPVLCAVDRGLIAGMLDVSGPNVAT